MKILRTLLCVFAIMISNHLIAQYKLSGIIFDKTDKTSGLPGVTVALTSKSDTTQKKGAVTDEEGHFIIENISAGKYRLQISYVGYKQSERNIDIQNKDIELNSIELSPSSTTLSNVTIEGKQVRAEQLGDTTQFNAGAYKTNPDANAEDLVTKMPGVTSENGTLKVNGENVKQVLVDGKPFFGDDPATAMKNLPAEVIDKIQVFDKLSDQAQFTGFDDGNSQKTINIQTKAGKNNGQFGKIYAGYGTDKRYIAGANVNMFKGNRRISMIGMSNNINQQNFSTEDLLGVTGTSSGQGRGGSSNFQRGGNNFRRGGGNRGGGNDASNFMVGQQSGIAATHAIGLNYSDNWGKKVKVSGSYFYNNANTNTNTTLERNYITQADNGLKYNETSTTNSKNQNHRINFRLEYEKDSSNSIIITPRLSTQQNNTTSSLSGTNMLADKTPVSSTKNSTTNDNIGYNFSNNILYRHKYLKKGRTLSLNLSTQYNYKTTDAQLYSQNNAGLTDTNDIDQQSGLTSDGYSISPNITYTEPVTKTGQLQISYNPSYTKNTSAKATNNFDSLSDAYTDLDTFLSNKFENTYTTHNGGLSYRINDNKLRAAIGFNAQYAMLEGVQTYHHYNSLEKSFTSLLPNAMFNYRFSNAKNLRIFYRTNTNAPSISQLQNVVDNSNPLFLRSGNPNLKQDYQHSLSMRYGATNTKTARSFFVFANVGITKDYIANATYLPKKDTTLINDVIVAPGSQLSMPVNMDGYFSGRTFVTYGFPIALIKSNLNLNGGVNYNRIPTLINSSTNLANNYTMNGGLTVGSNISEKIDFSVSYSGNYTIVKNSLQKQSDNTYYFQNTSLKFNWLFGKGFVFNTNLNHSLYTGLSQSFNQSFLLWNASFGYKFFKDRSLEAKVSVYDILNQNRAINRTVTETYIEDSHTNVLRQYFMLNLTYTLRKFKI